MSATSVLALSGCLRFYGANHDFACRTASDCLDGYVCVENVCQRQRVVSGGSGLRGDPAGGDSAAAGDPVTSGDPGAGAPASAVQITAGASHVCAALSDGTAMCWGINDDGELGNDNWGTNSSMPVMVTNSANVVQTTGGADHTCVRMRDGTASCWGNNDYGQLGVGPSGDESTPVPVPSLTGVTQLVTGDSHTCALTSGTVRCWGNDTFGQLGDGMMAPAPHPAAATVNGINDATALAAGGAFTCALQSDGTVECWGHNSYGQLGNDSRTDAASPVLVSSLTGATAIAAGEDHACALVANGAIDCWGDNTNGELGGSTNDWELTPVGVVASGTAPLTGATAVAAGLYFTCAVMANGQAMCWGRNSAGQLGNGDTTYADTSTPGTVLNTTGDTPLTGVSEVVAGYQHACALLDGGAVVCWGLGSYGQLGNGSFGSSTLPVDVTFP